VQLIVYPQPKYLFFPDYGWSGVLRSQDLLYDIGLLINWNQSIKFVSRVFESIW